MLSRTSYKLLREAIIDAFDKESLVRAWRVGNGLDGRLSTIVNTDDSFQNIVDRTLEFVENHDLEWELVSALVEVNPNNRKLWAASAQLYAELEGSGSPNPPMQDSKLQQPSAWNSLTSLRPIHIGMIMVATVMIAIVLALVVRDDEDPASINLDANYCERIGIGESKPIVLRPKEPLRFCSPESEIVLRIGPANTYNRSADTLSLNMFVDSSECVVDFLREGESAEFLFVRLAYYRANRKGFLKLRFESADFLLTVVDKDEVDLTSCPEPPENIWGS